MKIRSDSASYWIRTALWAFVLLALAKGIWTVVRLSLLPSEGDEPPTHRHVSALSYRITVASDRPLPKAPIRPKRPVLPRSTVRDYHLLATYVGSDTRLAVIEKSGHSHVLQEGEKIGGYTLKEVLDKAAVLERNGKEYRIEMDEKHAAGRSQTSRPAVSVAIPRAVSDRQTIHKEGDTVVVPRTKIREYSKNIGKITKNIGMMPYRKNGKLAGFKVRFVRRGSDFEKLGLRRGDVITEVNGEPLDNFETPMRLLRSADTLDDLIIKVDRNGKEMELEYEVQ